MADPPPTAMSPSHPCALNKAVAARTAASVGLDGVWSNTASGMPGRASIARCRMPAAFTPGSVTISGRVMPTRSHSWRSSRTAPCSNWMWVT